MDRNRQRLSIAVIVVFTVMLAATSKPAKDDKKNSTSSGATSTATAVADIDFERVRTAAKCAGKTTPGCTLLDEFASSMPYDAPTEEVVWYGESFGLGGATEVREPFFVQISTAG